MHNQSDGENDDDGGGGGGQSSAPIATTEDDDDDDDDDEDEDEDDEVYDRNVDNNNNTNDVEEENEDEEEDDDDEVIRRSALGAAGNRRATTTAACGGALRLHQEAKTTIQQQQLASIQLPSKVSRRRPPSGADGAVRRWNSFHSTRGECHPNKFRRERKSIASPMPSAFGGRHHQSQFASPRNPTIVTQQQQLQQRMNISGARAAICAERSRSLANCDTGLGPREPHKRAASIW